MIQIPFEDMLNKIVQSTGLSKDDIEKKVDIKMAQLAGLISKEGAIHIVANELGVKLFDLSGGRFKIKDILVGMRSLEVVGKVLQVYELRNFVSKDREGKVLSFVIGDDTGSVRVVAWGSRADDAVKLKQDVIVLIRNASSRDNQGRKEIHLGDRSELIVSPLGETVDMAKSFVDSRKCVCDVVENDVVELLGTIVQVFEPRFFEVCPECNKRLKLKDIGYYCDFHGSITPSYSYVVNFSLDDGTGIIRIACFRNQAIAVLNTSHEELLAFRENITEFKNVINKVIGSIVRIDGRIIKNKLFDRLEMIANNVILEPDPSNEIRKLNDESKNINNSF